MTTNSIHSSENIKYCLIKSKIPATPKPYSERKEKKRMSQCGKSCPYNAEGKSAKKR